MKIENKTVLINNNPTLYDYSRNNQFNESFIIKFLKTIIFTNNIK